jgi:hypothetical protein
MRPETRMQKKDISGTSNYSVPVQHLQRSENQFE